MTERLIRFEEWTKPVPAVRREVLSALPEDDAAHRPPVVFVPGFGHGAWSFAEHWLGPTAERGFPAYALNLRTKGTLRAYAHDVVQVAAGLPHRAILVGHGAGALVVTRALARYPARAAVLLAPVLHGPSAAVAALRANPAGTLPAAVGGRLRLSRRQLFRDLPEDQAKEYVSRLTAPGGRALWQLLTHRAAEPMVGTPPILVAGSPDDRIVSRKALDKAAARYGGAPLLFPGMGHDLMLDARWAEPLDAVLDWLEKQL